MIEDIIKDLNQNIDYSYKDVLLPVAHSILVKGQRIPGSPDGKTYKDAVPNDDKISIAFWEDYGAKALKMNARTLRYQSTMRLVVWLNMDKIKEQSRSKCISEMINAVPKFLQGYRSVYIRNIGILHSSEEIFNRYNFREDKQYMTTPYYAFALEYQIKYNSNRCEI